MLSKRRIVACSMLMVIGLVAVFLLWWASRKGSSTSTKSSQSTSSPGGTATPPPKSSGENQYQPPVIPPPQPVKANIIQPSGQKTSAVIAGTINNPNTPHPLKPGVSLAMGGEIAHYNDANLVASATESDPIEIIASKQKAMLQDIVSASQKASIDKNANVIVRFENTIIFFTMSDIDNQSMQPSHVQKINQFRHKLEIELYIHSDKNKLSTLEVKRILGFLSQHNVNNVGCLYVHNATIDATLAPGLLSICSKLSKLELLDTTCTVELLGILAIKINSFRGIAFTGSCSITPGPAQNEPRDLSNIISLGFSNVPDNSTLLVMVFQQMRFPNIRILSLESMHISPQKMQVIPLDKLAVFKVLSARIEDSGFFALLNQLTYVQTLILLDITLAPSVKINPKSFKLDIHPGDLSIDQKLFEMLDLSVFDKTERNMCIQVLFTVQDQTKTTHPYETLFFLFNHHMGALTIRTDENKDSLAVPSFLQLETIPFARNPRVSKLYWVSKKLMAATKHQELITQISKALTAAPINTLIVMHDIQVATYVDISDILHYQTLFPHLTQYAVYNVKFVGNTESYDADTDLLARKLASKCSVLFKTNTHADQKLLKAYQDMAKTSLDEVAALLDSVE
ncbi:hypothetical protein NEHOM01_1024 [Nematocida homosporus]|uniref:uncharacterized protein n=1 Tax=Nematocida homosporus TaxID=1912981 RepID=UPI00221F74B0|nr:uncharacterized protein NEHOM01_1024 [Nematocida homosporus]KAI5185732.1 hypothetical protein NEHOM01_1024 [Nematocida homosporus]